MHAVEKILARAAGKEKVETGEIVNCNIDFAEINDLYLQTVYSFYEMSGKKVWDKDKISFVFDHYSPAPTIKTAQIHKEMRQFAKEQHHLRRLKRFKSTRRLSVPAPADGWKTSSRHLRFWMADIFMPMSAWWLFRLQPKYFKRPWP